LTLPEPIQAAASHPFADQRPFILRESPLDFEQQSAVRIFTLSGLVQKNNLDVIPLQLRQNDLLCAQIASQAIRTQAQQNFEFTSRYRIPQTIQSRSGQPFPAYRLIHELAFWGKVELMSSRILEQLIHLALDRCFLLLFAGRYSGI
jgi:hypothetical protein